MLREGLTGHSANFARQRIAAVTLRKAESAEHTAGARRGRAEGYVSNGVCFVDYGTNINNGVPLDEDVNQKDVITAVPEPASCLLLGSGLALLAGGLFTLARRRERYDAAVDRFGK